MNSMIDFSLAKAQHSLWKIKLRSFLHGQSEIQLTEFVSHRDCLLGKWLYATGLAKYGSIPEMQSLETIHQKLHVIASRIVEMKRLGQVDAAERELAQLEPLSEKIVDLLNSVEQKVKHKLP
ncbi:MAG: CZB domain-containing protein [Hormoscilla sp.]